MKFRKRMKPILKKIDDVNYEAVDWYRSKDAAIRKAREYRNNGFRAKVVFEDWWAGYFVYVRI